jgi:UDP-glucuronate decarboxylase
MSKRILVTGGAGFLGSHLCERLIAQGEEVVCLDNLFTGRRENIAALLDDHRFEFVRHDVTEPIILEVDEVYHLACPASPVHYQRNPVRTIRTTVQGTLNMLELAREVNARILIASTSEVYGDPEVHPQVESYWGNVNPIGERSCYDEGKRCAEALAVSYSRQYDVGVRIARIFNTYGPRLYENDGRVVSNFIVQALRDDPLTVYGDGSQTRSFCYVDDTIEGLVRMMASEHGSDPVNIGTQFEFTVLELAKQVIELTGSRSEITREPLPADDPKQRRADTTRAKELLDWEPRVALRDGLILTVNYFRQRVQRAGRERPAQMIGSAKRNAVS